MELQAALDKKRSWRGSLELDSTKKEFAQLSTDGRLENIEKEIGTSTYLWISICFYTNRSLIKRVEHREHTEDHLTSVKKG